MSDRRRLSDECVIRGPDKLDLLNSLFSPAAKGVGREVEFLTLLGPITMKVTTIKQCDATGLLYNVYGVSLDTGDTVTVTGYQIDDRATVQGCGLTESLAATRPANTTATVPVIRRLGER